MDNITKNLSQGKRIRYSKESKGVLSSVPTHGFSLNFAY